MPLWQKYRRSLWWLYVKIHREEYRRIKKIINEITYGFFYWWYVIFINVNINRIKWINFLVHFYHHKSIGKIITDGLFNNSQITDKSSFYRVLLSVSLSIKFVLIDWEYKYQYKIPSLNLKILVVRNIFISLLNSLLDSMFPNLIKWWSLSNVGLDSCFLSVCFRCQNVEYIIVYL